MESKQFELTNVQEFGLFAQEVAMDELLQRALERREQLRAELEALESFIRSYSEVQDRRVPRASTDLFSSAKRPRRRRTAETEAAMRDAVQLILENGHPMSRTALLKALSDRGHEIEGADKSKVLGTKLWRSKLFYNIKGAGYWPISAPVPEEFKDLQLRESMLLD